MANTSDEVLSWLEEQPYWIQRAANIILTKGLVDDDDVHDIVKLIKSENGRKPKTDITFPGLTNTHSTHQHLKLSSLSGVQGIDRLSSHEPLEFGSGNLVVIYGNNGSGKSGYTRILKKVCGKPRATELKSNVFKTSSGVKTCKVEYELNGTKNTVLWANNGAIHDLKSVDIFDELEGEFYLHEETEVTYIPREILLFEQLTQVCSRVRSELETDQSLFISSLPQIPWIYKDCETYRAYTSLNKDLSVSKIDHQFGWYESDEQELKSINEKLQAGDISKLISEKVTRKRHVEQIIQSIRKSYELVSTESCLRYNRIALEAKEKRTQATEGAKAITQSAQLNGIGTSTWISLWKAAQAFSTEQAYPHENFPVTGENSKCVLCHQPISEEASIRLKEFNEYVGGILEKNATDAEEVVRRAFNLLPSSPTDYELTTIGDAANLSDELRLRLNQYWNDVSRVKKELTQNFSKAISAPVYNPAKILEDLSSLSSNLSLEIEQHKKDINEKDISSARKKKLELECKKWTSNQIDAIKQEVERQIKFGKIEELKSQTNTQFISKKVSSLTQSVITEAYVKRFNEELAALGASNIQVELVKTRVHKAKDKHKLRLKNVNITSGSPTAVLSDGEMKVVSLAAFLANVTGRPEKCTFVFDDPISSLDHQYEWRVACRLAKLALDRQVIVLTHRLSLYGMLEDAEEKVKKETGISSKLEQRYITSVAGKTGVVTTNESWMQKTKAANNTLLTRLQKVQKDYEGDNDVARYEDGKRAVCSEFRKLLERTIEHDLLFQIVQRHKRGVMTNNKLDNLTRITKDDAVFLDGLMTKYSAFEHSQSDELPVETPEKEEIQSDLEALRDWRNEFSSRKVN